MNNSQDIILLLMLSTLAQSTGAELSTNSNFLLLLFLALSNNSCGCSGCSGCSNCNTCSNCNSCCNNRFF